MNIPHGGIASLATGQNYPTFPSIFPNATTQVAGEDILLIPEPPIRQQMANVKSQWYSTATTWVKQHPYMAAAGGVLGGAICVQSMATAATLSFVSTTAFALYRNCKQRAIPRPQNQIYPSLRYSQEEDAYVTQILSSRSNNPLVEDIDFAFRNYRLNVYNAKQVEKKIHSLIVQHKLNKPDSPSILLEMDGLFAAGLAAREKIHNQPIFVFIGQTGSGKTTAANYLCGRNMRAVDPTFLRGIPTEVGQTVIIAENSLGDIGHKGGIGSSETTDPQIFQDEEKGIIYCDCPGLGDNRKKAVAMCNSLAIVDIIMHAEALRGFLFFINYTELTSGRQDTIINKDMKVLQMLLKNFTPYQNTVLFVITKTNSNVLLESLPNFLLKILQSAVDHSPDQELAGFCKEIIDSQSFKRIAICNPCSSNGERLRLIDRIQNLAPIDNPREINPHPPLTPDVFRDLDEIKRNIQNEIQSTLIQFGQKFSLHWLEKIEENHSVAGAKVLFDKLDLMQQSPVTIESIILNDENALFDSMSIENLRRGLAHWEKVTFLSPSPKTLSAIVDFYLKGIENELVNLKYQCFKSSFKAALETYNLQKKINALGQQNNLQIQSEDRLIATIKTLMNDAGAQIFYGDQLQEVIQGLQPFEIHNLKTLVQSNIQHPFVISTQERCTTVTCQGKKVALSQIIEKLQGLPEFGDCRELRIVQQKTLYLDRDLKGQPFKGKNIYIESEVEIMKKCVVNLFSSLYRQFSFTIKGSVKGSIEAGNAEEKKDRDIKENDDDVIFFPTNDGTDLKQYFFHW